MKRFVFIGCGPTTLGATYAIQQLIDGGTVDADDVQVTVLERGAVPGGLAASVVDDKGFAWDMGVHIHAHPSKYSCFTRCVDEAVDEWNMITRNVKADMAHIFRDTTSAANGHEAHSVEQHFVPYPVQLAVPLFPPEIRNQCLQDIRNVQSQKYEKKPKNFAEWTNRAFGDTLEHIFMRPYNKKVWTVSLEEMNSVWVGDRVATIDVDKLTAVSQKDPRSLTKEDLGWGPNQLFKYPAKLTGCGFTWQKVCARQPAHWFHFNREAVRIDPDKKQVLSRSSLGGGSAAEETVHDYDHVLSTMPITLLGQISGLAPDIQLQHSKVMLVGFGLEKPQPEFTRTLNWAYFPAEDLVFYRCTFLSNFNAVMTPDADRYWSLVVEIGLTPDAPVDEEQLTQATIDGLCSRGILNGPEQIVSRWSQLLPYGYPIPTVNRDEQLRKAHALLQPHGIHSRGRFGGWRYEVANQDHSFAQGYEWAHMVLCGQKETVYNALA